MVLDERDQKVWASMTRNLRADKSEEDRWTCQIVVFAGAIVAAGIVALLLAQTWLPLLVRALFFFGTFAGVMFAGLNLCGSWQSAMGVMDALDAKGGEKAESAGGSAAPRATATATGGAAAVGAAPGASAAASEEGAGAGGETSGTAASAEKASGADSSDAPAARESPDDAGGSRSA